MRTNATGLTRRDSLKLAGSAGLLGLLSGHAAWAQNAPAKPKTSANPGFYRFAVGDVEIVMIADGTFPFPAPHPLFGGNAKAEEVNEALVDSFIAPDKVFGVVHAMVIRAGSEVVLVDTGCGNGLGPTTGKFSQHLQAAGMTDADITAVVLTHAHGDHMGGLLNADGKSRFPNAELLMNKTEYDFWTAAPDLSKTALPPEMQQAFIKGAQTVLKAVKWTLVEGEKEVRPKVRVLPAPGHTPGHLTLLIDGGGTDQLYYITDAIHHAAIQMPNPGFHVAFDTDREQAVATRKKILDRASADKLLVAGTHLPFPAVGHVKALTQGYQWYPSYWNWDNA